MRRLVANIAQALGERAHPIAAFPVQGDILQAVQAGGVGCRQAQGNFTRLAQVKITQCGQHRLQPPIGQGNLQWASAGIVGVMDRYEDLFIITALGQQRLVEQFRMSAQQVEQDRQQAQAFAVDHDPQFQVEPVTLRRFVDHGVPIVDRGQVEGEVFGVLDFPA
ncbi:hypothetical protein D9M71_521690 [compost metagenome]